jgi:hypothetical protein
MVLEDGSFAVSHTYAVELQAGSKDEVSSTRHDDMIEGDCLPLLSLTRLINVFYLALSGMLGSCYVPRMNMSRLSKRPWS